MKGQLVGLVTILVIFIESGFIFRNSRELIDTNLVKLSQTENDRSLVRLFQNEEDNNTELYNTLVKMYSNIEQLCFSSRKELPETKKVVCPCISPLLKGYRPIKETNVPSITELENTISGVQHGGYSKPQYCEPWNRVTIIVPYRDRAEHLKIFLSHMHPYLQRQLVEYRLFVVEQANDQLFNKAMMMNIGFVESQKMFKSNCIIFHDVDTLPEDDRNLYTCTELPRHVGPYVSTFNYSLLYPTMFGATIAMSPAQFRTVNGFSNQYFGWGGEDDDMYNRVRAQGFKIKRFPKAVARYTSMQHERDKLNPMNKKRYKGLRRRPGHYTNDGLTTLEYQLKEIVERPLFTWIYADIEMPKSLTKYFEEEAQEAEEEELSDSDYYEYDENKS